MEATSLLAVENLQVSFSLGPFKGSASAIEGVSFNLAPGESLALVGESGSGKSVTALTIMQLIKSGGGRIENGSVLFENRDLIKLSNRDMRRIRGYNIGMIFQEPMTSLNPVFTVGEQIAEVFRIHQHCSHKEAWDKAISMLESVKIPSARERVHAYPHELSGGMRQRVMIAIALACKPKLLIADEPTTALDVTIQAQIMKLIVELQSELGMALLLITHDLGVVAESCDRIAVMYGGQIVETGAVSDVFAEPRHPYTQGLMRAVPRLGEKAKRLQTIEGIVPALGAFPQGCRFQNRCPHAFEKCRQVNPADERQASSSQERMTACWLVGESNDG